MSGEQASFGIKSLHLKCNKDEETSLLSTIKTCAESATKKAVDGFQLLMAKGREFPAKSTSRRKQRSDINGDDEDDEIFSDLLEADGLDSNGIQLQQSTTPVYILQSCDIVSDVTDTPIGLCATGDFIAITTETVTHYETSIFRNVDTCSENEFFRDPIRCLSLPKHKYEGYNRTQNHVLMKVVTAEIIQQSHIEASAYVNIDNNLFKQLFGQDTALLGSPVLLVCPPEGAVYFAPIKAIVTNFSQPVIQSQTNHSFGTANRSGWRLFCQTSTHVCNILEMSLAVKLQNDTNSPGELSDAQFAQKVLAIVSKNGSVLVYHADERNPISCHPLISRITINDPVMAVCSHYNKLYHSTGKFLYQITLDIIECVVKGEPRETRGAVKAVSSATAIIHHAGIVGMQSRIQDGFIDSRDSPCMLSCALKCGEIKDLNPSEKSGQNDLPSSGERIKDILVAIDRVDTKRNEVQSQLQVQDYWLKQINIAAYLLRLNLSQDSVANNRMQTEPMRLHQNDASIPFSCFCKATVPTGDEEDQVVLQCEITNQMSHSLSHDWTLVMTLIPTNEVTASDHMARSLKLNSAFKPHDSVTISLPVKPEWIYSGFKATISAVLTIRDKTFNKLSNGDTADLECLFVSIYTEDIDILYFMLPNTARYKYMCVDVTDYGAVNNTIHKIAEDKPSSRCLLQSTEQEKISEMSASVTVQVFFREETIKSLEEKFGKGLLCILNYLLHNSQTRDISTCDYNTITMLGHPVFISVCYKSGDITQKQKDDMQSREITHVEVNIRCELKVSAAIYRAVSHRLEMLETMVIRPPVPVNDLRRHLQTLQEIDEEICTLQQRRMSKKEASHVMSTVYEKLRSIHV